MSNELLDSRRKLLVGALRSGKYNQIRLRLGNNDGFCCLGVACEVAIEAGASVPKRANSKGTFSYDDCNTSMPWSVMAFFGFKSSAGTYGADRDESLMKLNDFSHKSFSEIADVIESKPEGMFED